MSSLKHFTHLTTFRKRKELRNSNWNICEISVFARCVNSTMKRRRAHQWPESVLVGNPYSGTMLKYIKTFCIFFCVAPTRNNIFPKEVYNRSDFGAFLAKFWALFEKAAGLTTCIVAEHTPNSRDIFFWYRKSIPQ